MTLGNSEATPTTPLTLQRIFHQHFPTYAKRHRLPRRAHQAARAIIACRTAALGGHLQQCPEGHVARIHYNACRHRSCSRCSALPRAQWAAAQAARLLACDHYHVVFTLPHELLDLWQMNRAWLANALFQAARDTLMTLLADRRFLGATPGIVMALHTWGRTLSRHPHVHCLVTGGGLTDGGEWKPVRNGYLLPVRVVKALYKGKLLAALGEALARDALRLPAGVTKDDLGRGLKALQRQNWNVHLQERYPHGRGVMNYLARYVKGGPISDHRLQSADAATITFSYKDHHDGKQKRMTLATDEFIGRVLWHVPEPGLHTIRHYGLYAHRDQARRAQCRAQLGQPPYLPARLTWQDFLGRLGHGEQARCPQCAQPLTPGRRLPRPGRGDTISIGRQRSRNVAQLGVQADTPNVTRSSSGDPPDPRGSFVAAWRAA